MSVMKPEPLDITIEQMSEKSLELAQKKIDRRLAEIKKENEEKKKRKRPNTTSPIRNQITKKTRNAAGTL